jgi:hypothetical protein
MDAKSQKEKLEIFFAELESENKQILQQENFSMMYSWLR